MKLEDDIVKGINSGKFTPEILDSIVLGFLISFREQILQKFYRNKAENSQKQFAEYLLIETTRALYKMKPVTFYIHLRTCQKLRHILKLQYLTSYSKWREFDRKRKYYKRNFENTIKRNLKKSVGNMYILDTTIGETDLSRIRKGKKIKNGAYDAEFVFSPTKGTVVGFIVCTLIDWSNLSVKKIKFYPKTASKKRMWKEMVLDTVGTKTGKIKVVLADAGFFAYQNYLWSPHYRVVPVIKSRKNLKEKVLKKIKSIPASLLWWDSKYNSMLEELLEEFHEIIELTLSLVEKYSTVKKKRARIEYVFKTAKLIFGMKDLHVYFRDTAFWKVYIQLYIASLFLQYLEINNVNMHRVMELLRQNHGLM